MSSIFTNRTIGITSFSIGTNPTIGADGHLSFPLYSTANDPQPANDPRPQVIPKVDRK